ncbi:hypothetical protein RclHR1_10260006 [Rhizophagus clarus]|nr:hypothetical protein RclHR1_10260006 [Rhizophagus clarus]
MKFLGSQDSVPIYQEKQHLNIQREIKQFNPPSVTDLMLRSVLNYKPQDKLQTRLICSSGIDKELYSIMNWKPQSEHQRRSKYSSNMNKLSQYKRSVKRPAMRNRQYNRYFR